MAAYAQEGVDRSVHSTEEVESVVGAPTLAVVPLERDASTARRPFLAAIYGGRNKDFRDFKRAIALTTCERPQSLLAEAYRSLRTAILLSAAPTPPKLLLVTSTHAGEGKTSTAMNLAQSMAQRKGPVLLLDCDMRRGSLGRLFGLDTQKGLSTVLTGTSTLAESLQPCAVLPNLWILPSGPTPPNPAELLTSDTMAKLFKALAARFEHVVIDSPPVMAVTDATIISNLADGVVLVAESGTTARGGLLRTRIVLENAGARILGVVLNKFDWRQEGFYYGYYRYYQYYQKYPYGKKDKTLEATSVTAS
jgi:capsular exopolysaccharide synthesis family protein